MQRGKPNLYSDSDFAVALTATKQGSAAFKRLGFATSDKKPGKASSLLSDEAQMMERRGNHSFLTDP